LPCVSVGDAPARDVSAEHCAFAPWLLTVLLPLQVHSHSPAFLPVPAVDAEAVPLKHRLPLGGVIEASIAAIPQTPLTLEVLRPDELLDELLLEEPPLGGAAPDELLLDEPLDELLLEELLLEDAPLDELFALSDPELEGSTLPVALPLPD
jgi:hypothetical protein